MMSRNKNTTPAEEVPAKSVEEEAATEEAEASKEAELVKLAHFIKNGSMTIEGTTYDIVDGIVEVKPEHAAQAKRHIAMGG